MPSSAKATFIDCPPFLHDLYRGELTAIVPDLVINVGSPSAEEVKEKLADSRFALLDHTTMDAALLEACSHLEAIVFLGLGAGSFIDLDAAERFGIRVRNYGGYGDQSVAEHALALMFAAGRRIAAMDRAVRAGVFEPLDGIEFAGRTLGVVGTGGIGRAMIRLGAGIGMKVIAWNRSGVPDDLPCRSADLDELLAKADVVSLHMALNDKTRGFIDARRLGLLKPTAILVNTARGAVLDEKALMAALESEKIAHAALDVFEDEPISADHPLAKLDNTTLTPHAAFMTKEASARLLKMALDILKEEMASA